MKLSNKILIGFFTIIFLYLTATFTEVRLRGSSSSIDDENSKVETVDITGVNYLVLPDLEKIIEVVGSDQPRLEIRSLAGNFLQKLQYNVSGDTLTLTQLKLDEDQKVRITIYVPKNSLRGMTVNGSRVDINGLEQKELTILQTQGSIQLEEDNNIGKLTIKASDRATFNIFDTAIEVLSLELDNSSVYSNASVKLLEGSMTNASSINLGATEEIQFKKDDSSRINFY